MRQQSGMPARLRFMFAGKGSVGLFEDMLSAWANTFDGLEAFVQSWAPMVRNTDHDDDDDEVDDDVRDDDGAGRDDDAFHDDHLGQVADDIDGTIYWY